MDDSYLDAVIDNGTIHLFCPHLWNRAIYVAIQEDALTDLPTIKQLDKLATTQPLTQASFSTMLPCLCVFASRPPTLPKPAARNK